MRKVVISLSDSSDRRDAFFAQPRATGFEVFDAVDLRHASETELRAHVDVEAFRVAYGRRPRAGEVGCLASHLSVIKRFAAEGGGDSERLVVCEDDGVLLAGFEEVIASRLPTHLDIVVLGFGLPFSLPGMTEERTIARVVPLSPLARRLPDRRRVGLALPNGSMGMVGYTLTAEAARRVARATRSRPGWPVDDFAAWRSHGISAGLVQPGVIRQASGFVSTTIDPVPHENEMDRHPPDTDREGPTELELREQRIAHEVSRLGRRAKLGVRLSWWDVRDRIAFRARRGHR